jgi:hypothetical protein
MERRPTALEEPPVRFAAGTTRWPPSSRRWSSSTTVPFEQKAHDLLSQAHAHRELATNLAYHDT